MLNKHVLQTTTGYTTVLQHEMQLSLTNRATR